jgi:negative regulator of sigma E activity
VPGHRAAAAGSSRAGEPAPTAAPTDARGWLSRIHVAANGRNYQGTMVFSTGGVVSSSRVAHFCVGDQVFERIEALDGKQRQVYRHNDLVHTVWPQAGLAVIERRNLQSNLPSATQSVDPRALDQYELRPEGRDRVAGRDAFVFLLQPRDEWRFAQRVWADHDTGLMLRSDVIGPAAPCWNRPPSPSRRDWRAGSTRIGAPADPQARRRCACCARLMWPRSWRRKAGV